MTDTIYLVNDLGNLLVKWGLGSGIERSFWDPEIQKQNPNNHIRKVKINRDEKTIAVQYDYNEIRVWDSSTKKTLFQSSDKTSSLIGFDGADNLVVSSAGGINFWNLSSNKIVKSFNTSGSSQLTENGMFLTVSKSVKEVQVIDLNNDTEIFKNTFQEPMMYALNNSGTKFVASTTSGKFQTFNIKP